MSPAPESPDWDTSFDALRRALAGVGWLTALLVGSAVKASGADLLDTTLRGAAAWIAVAVLGALGINVARTIVGAPRPVRRRRTRSKP